MDSNKPAKIESSAPAHSATAQIAVMTVDHCEFGKSSPKLFDSASRKALKSIVQHSLSELRNHEDTNLKLTGEPCVHEYRCVSPPRSAKCFVKMGEMESRRT